MNRIIGAVVILLARALSFGHAGWPFNPYNRFLQQTPRIRPRGGAILLTDQEIEKLPKSKPDVSVRDIGDIPESFDARTNWLQCPSIGEIWDQGACGTCWAVVGAAVLADRICVATGQKDHYVSASQAASCPRPDRTPDQNCQAGGDATYVWRQASLFGINTGGMYGASHGCVPYNVPPLSITSRPTPILCASSCTNRRYSRSLNQDLQTVDGYWTSYWKSDQKMKQSDIDAAVRLMQADILVNGPLAAVVMIYDDFYDFGPRSEPYCSPRFGAKQVESHVVRVIGWGKSPRGRKYWLAANSWGSGIGDKGFWRIEMGKNCLGVERRVSAPIINMTNNCYTTDFCTEPINEAIQMNPNDPNSPIFLFLGNCVQQVRVDADGTVSAVGEAEPLSKRIIGGPEGPITGYRLSKGRLWIVNRKQEAGANCVIPKGSTKVSCEGGSVLGLTPATAVIPGARPVTWKYYPDDLTTLYRNNDGFGISDLITSEFERVNGFLNVDGKSMLVFGVDANGKAKAGILSYPDRGTAQWLKKPASQEQLFGFCAPKGTTTTATTTTTAKSTRMRNPRKKRTTRRTTQTTTTTTTEPDYYDDEEDTSDYTPTPAIPSSSTVGLNFSESAFEASRRLLDQSGDGNGPQVVKTKTYQSRYLLVDFFG